jgi:glycerol-3-phosphate O-acyltransferase/dihydroxyacetone phosphate acyltransferase
LPKLQRFSKGYNALKDHPDMQQMVGAISSYRMMLKLMNIRDDQVVFFEKNFIRSVGFMLISLVRLLLSLIFVLPGNIMCFPLTMAISFYSEAERIKALKGSTVKVKANDVLSSVKIIAYLATYPIYLMLFIFLFNRTLRWHFMVERGLAYTYTTIFFFIFPIISIVSIRSYDGVRTHYTEF